MRFFKDEREFTRWVLDEARQRGWMAAHFPSMRTVRTRQGDFMQIPDKDARGFPDLVLARDARLVFAELKTNDHRSHPTPEQIDWMIALRAANQEVYLWRPHQQAEVLDVLDGGTPVDQLFSTKVGA